MDKLTPPKSNMKKTYGSTGETTTLTRNEQSVGGGTAITNESEPLLGERWANDEDENPSTPAVSKIDETKPFYTDASTIDKEDSDDDPHIGINVFTNDTLSYSRDDSTLGLNDRYWRGGTPRGSRLTIDGMIEEEDDRRKGGILRSILPGGQGESNSQVYFLVCFGLSVGIALCSVAALLYVEYWHHYGVDVLPDPVNNGTGGGQVDKTSLDGSWHGVPFAKVTRESFGDPVSNILDVDLFHPSLLYRENAKKALQQESSTEPFFKFAFPTGAFWTNLVLLPVSNKQQSQQQSGSRKLISSTNPKNSRSENQYSYPIVAYPYSYQWSSAGKLQASYSAARRTTKPDSIQDAFAPDISFGSAEDITARHVINFDSLSVSLRFYSEETTSSSGYWESYIVQGSPYITARYYGLTPELTALSDFKDITCPPTMNQLKVKLTDEPDQSKPFNSTTTRRLSSTTSATGTDTSKMLGICDVSDDSTQHNKIISGVQFVISTKEGLTWLIFASEPITFVFDQNARRTIASKDSFGGVIRAALVPPASKADASMSFNSYDTNFLASSPGVKRLIYHGKVHLILRAAIKFIINNTFCCLSS